VVRRGRSLVLRMAILRDQTLQTPSSQKTYSCSLSTLKTYVTFGFILAVILSFVFVHVSVFLQCNLWSCFCDMHNTSLVCLYINYILHFQFWTAIRRPLLTIRFQLPIVKKPDNTLILLIILLITHYSVLSWLVCCTLDSNEDVTHSNMRLVTPPKQQSGCPSQTSTVPKLYWVLTLTMYSSIWYYLLPAR